MSKVAVVRCTNYEYAEVRRAVERGVLLLGGTELFVQRGEHLLLKPNLLSATAPEKCVTTHPAVFKAVAEVLLSAGVSLSYGDSPAFVSMQSAARKSGIARVAEELGIAPADFKTGVDIYFDEGRQNRKFVIAGDVLKSIGIISIPKFKTHGLERITGCIKNQFGCIPGILKGEYHVKIPDANDFARMLVDLNRLVHPRLYVLDAIRAMEGNGPNSGTPRQMNMLLLSDDPVALDATACRTIALNPEYVPTIRYGSECGLGTYDEADIELAGDPLDEFRTEDFDVDRTPVTPYRATGLTRFISNTVVPKPLILKERCVRCGVCIDMCPARPKALHWVDGGHSHPPAYNYHKCIRRYCCQEVCPQQSAIILKLPLMRSLLGPLLT